LKNTLAELDQSLFEVTRKTYEGIVELGHYRETLTDFLAGETLAPVTCPQCLLVQHRFGQQLLQPGMA
jgi:hypothetical protein